MLVFRGWELMFCECGLVLQVRTLTGHLEGVRSVAFSPDGTRIISGSEDGLVKIWDAKTGVEVSNGLGVR